MTKRSGGDFKGRDRIGSHADIHHEVVDLLRWRREHGEHNGLAAHISSPHDQMPYGRLAVDGHSDNRSQSSSSRPAEVLPFHGHPRKSESDTTSSDARISGEHHLMPRLRDEELREILLDRLCGDETAADDAALPAFDASGNGFVQVLKQRQPQTAESDFVTAFFDEPVPASLPINPSGIARAGGTDSDLEDLEVIGDLFLDPRFAPRTLSHQAQVPQLHVPEAARSDAPVAESVASFAAARLAAQRQRHWGLDWLIAHVEAELNDARAIQAILADMRQELDLLEGSVQQLRDAAAAERDGGAANEPTDIKQDLARLQLLAQFLRGAGI